MTTFHLLLFVLGLLACSPALAKRKNVLFLAVDDLRPELESYGFSHMHTPNFNRLAQMGLQFERAYVQQAVCSPSRTSLLTGRRPDTTHVYDLVHYWRHLTGNFTTIPQYFKDNGYITLGAGKIFHPGVASGHDDPISWTEPFFHSPTEEYWGKIRLNTSWMAVSDELMKQHPLKDTVNTNYIMGKLETLAKGEQPFFAALGWHKPHLPFLFPERFLQYYPEGSVHIASNQLAPEHMPPIAWSAYGELRQYHDIADLHASGKINTTLPDPVQIYLRRGYYAATSYTDYNLGEILDLYFKLGLDNDTILILWGDHGWQLGEHGEWCKHTDFELATHATMFFYDPDMKATGQKTQALTEFVDIFPTLVELTDLPKIPTCPEDSKDVLVCTEGMSFAPLLQDPTKQWKSASFSQYPRDGQRVMGYTMVDDKYRYTEWVKFDNKTFTMDWSEQVGVELYDHVNDPNENFNVALESTMKSVVAQYSTRLHDGWRKAVPPK